MIGYYSAWPLVLILAALLALAATTLFRAADSPPSPTATRVSTLDGLRGFLALAVFFHHAALYHTFIQDGLWQPPSDRLYALLGPFGVSMFFMITGFLFWAKVVDKQGKPGWVRLYVSRLFRIGPIYLAAIAIMTLTVFASTGFHLRVGPFTLLRQLAEWSALGLRSGSPINGYAAPGVLLANVTWSLRWEWFFYASLIVTGLFARNRIASTALPAVGLAISLALLVRANAPASAAPQPAAFIALFCAGMLTATARKAVAGFGFGTPVWSAVAAGLIVAVLALFQTAYAALPICILGAAFFLIANGASLFGLLVSRPARRLGDVSFGIYLLQGLVLAGAFAAPQVRSFALSSALGHWFVVGCSGLVLISVATVTHAVIERPGIDAGHRLLARLGRKSTAHQIILD